MKYPGSRWWSFDFHNHTPASSDYLSQERGSVTPRDWLLAYMNKSIDCVAVTDHNCGDWIDRLQSEYLLMSKEEPLIEGFRPLYIFPGVELTASGGLHILAIFDKNESSSIVHTIKVLAKCNEHSNNAESMCSESPEAICAHIRQQGGISILAHVEDANGVFEGTTDASTGGFSPRRGGREIDHVLAKCDALESHDLAHPALIHFSSKTTEKALVDGSDAHRLSHAGTRSVWIKMAEPSIEGLRLALLDPDSSVMRPDIHSIFSSPAMPTRRIVSCSVSQLYRKRQSPLETKFNPWFNCVIGGRGSGKSTLLEILRLGLAREGDLSQLGKESDVYRAFQRFRKVSGVSDSTGMLRDDTEIVVDVEKDDGTVKESYRYKWNKEKLSIYRLDETGDWEDTNVDSENAAKLFPLKIFSQKQVFEVAGHPSALLTYIDKSPEVNFEEWSREHESLRRSFRDMRIRERNLKEEISRKPIVENELKEVVRKTTAYQQSSVASQVKVFRESQSNKKSINDFSAQVDGALQLVEEIVGQSNPFELLSPIIVSEGCVGKDDLQRAGEELKSRLTGHYDQLQKTVSAMRGDLDRFLSQDIVVNTLAGIESTLASYRAEVAKLAEQGIGTAQQAEAALQRKQELEADLKKIEKCEKEQEVLQDRLLKSFIRLKFHRRLLTKRRQRFVNEVLTRIEDLRIFVEGQADVDASKDAFRKILRLQDNTFVDQILGDEGTQGVRAGLLGKLVSHEIRDPVHSRVTALKQGLLEGNKEILGESLHAKFLSAISRLSVDDYDSLLEWFPEDRVRVEYRRDPKQKFESLERASAGQKTAAILSFLLAHGDEPLLLDQPEDDLDNALVYSLVVKQIREHKSRRQIIVITHNPNIVVNGDAELVIPMEFKNGEIHLVDAGGLQQRSVREKICAVMEGGRDAFRQRYKRILEDMEATS